MSKKTEGVISIEAAFIMPIFIGVLLSIIIVGMYMHDLCVTKQLVQADCNKMLLAIFKEYNVAANMIDLDKRMNRNIVCNSLGVVTGNFYQGDKRDYLKNMKKALSCDLKEKLLVSDATNVTVKIKGGKIQIDVSVNSRFNKGATSLIWGMGQSQKISCEKYEVDECELIRLTSVVAEG